MGARLRYALGALLLLTVGRSVGMLPVFRDSLQSYLGIGDARFGLLFSLAAFAGVASVVAGGVMVDRRGPVAVMRLGFAGVALSFLVIGLAGGNWWLMAVAMVLNGLCVRPLGVAVNALLVRLFPSHKRRVLSLNFVAGSSGDFLFPAFAEGLLFLAHTVRSVTFGLVLRVPFAVFSVVLFLGSLLYPKDSGLQDGGDQRQRPLRQSMVLPRRALGLIFLATMHGTADTMLFVWLPRFLGSDFFQVRPIAPGLFMSGFAVSYLVGRSALALLPEGRWRHALMVLPGILGGGVMIAGILSRDYVLTGFGYVLGGLLWSVEFPVFLGRLAEEAGDRFGSAMALQQMLTAGASGIGLALTGWAISRAGEQAMWQVLLVPACIFPCIGLCAAGWLFLRRDSGS